MVVYLWALGIVFTLAVFAIKVGLGLAVYAASRRRKLLSLVLYQAIFLTLGGVLEGINLLDYFSFFIDFLRYGMVIHVALATGLLLWGLYLLRDRGQEMDRGQRAIWLLLLPCPVCLTAILLSLSLSKALFGYKGILLGVGLGGIFNLLVVLVMLLSSHIWQRRGQVSFYPHRHLALVMLGVGGYFFLSILLVPAYQQARQVYRLASRSGLDIQDPGNSVLVILSILVLFIVGLVKRRGELKG